MDLTRLSQGEKIAAGSGILLFTFMFFKWFPGSEGAIIVEEGHGFASNISMLGPPDQAANAWNSLDWIRWILLLTAIAAVGFPLLKASGNEVTMAVTPSTIVTVLGGLAFLLVLYRIINPPGEGLGREIGVFLGLFAAAGITFGGYSAMQAEGTSFKDATDTFSSSGGEDQSGRGDTPPPPPPPPGN